MHGEALVRITPNPLHWVTVEAVWSNLLTPFHLPASLHFEIVAGLVQQSLRQYSRWPVWLSLLGHALGQSLEKWVSSRQIKLIYLFHFLNQCDGYLLSLHLRGSNRRAGEELQQALGDGSVLLHVLL